jgi:hypothetical protein
MGIWSTIGHAALQYGPYVAAPFTGGASLALAPAAAATNAAWNAAQQTTATPGATRTMNQYGPSGLVSKGQILTPEQLQGMFPGGDVSGKAPASIISPGTSPDSSSQTGSPIGPSNPSDLASQAGGGNVFKPLTSYAQPKGLFSQALGMMPEDSSNPNLSTALNQGKMNALRNQPWRSSRGIYPNQEGQ